MDTGNDGTGWAPQPRLQHPAGPGDAPAGSVPSENPIGSCVTKVLAVCDSSDVIPSIEGIP